MGMRVLRRLDFPGMTLSLYFLAHLFADNDVPEIESNRTPRSTARVASRSTTLGQPAFAELRTQTAHIWRDEQLAAIAFAKVDV